MNNFQQQFEALYGGVDLASTQSNVFDVTAAKPSSNDTGLLLIVVGSILVVGAAIAITYIIVNKSEEKEKIFVAKN